MMLIIRWGSSLVRFQLGDVSLFYLFASDVVGFSRSLVGFTFLLNSLLIGSSKYLDAARLTQIAPSF